MDFTREPMIESIITPKEGYKLVIRSSKNSAQEEFVVDAVEIVAFGHALFFRSLERPKAFLVPVSDYEAIEVREARMVLKNAGLDRSIKIGGGREGPIKASREMEKEEIISEVEQQEIVQEVEVAAPAGEVRVDKKRDRRRHYRKRRGREEQETEEKDKAGDVSVPQQSQEDSNSSQGLGQKESAVAAPLSPTVFSALLQPPPTLISETIGRYRQNFKDAFYLTEDEQYKPHDKVDELLNEDDDDISVKLAEPQYAAESEINEMMTENRQEELLDGIEKEDLFHESNNNACVEESILADVPLFEEVPLYEEVPLFVVTQEETESVSEHYPAEEHKKTNEKNHYLDPEHNDPFFPE